MDNYFLVRRIHRDGDIFIKEFEDPADFGEDYMDGNPYPKGSPPAKFFYRSAQKRETDLLLGIFSIPVVSERFRDVATQHEPDKLEFHPVELICHETGASESSYFFMNILDNVSCFDRERSRFRSSEVAPAVLSSIEELVLNESMIDQRHLFRMKEFDTLIFASAALRDAIEQAELSGVRFSRLDEYPE